MRPHTNGKHEIRKRFAVVIGVAAVGVMALGAQTGAAGGAPHLKLSGHKKQFGPRCPDRCVPPRVGVLASCGEVSGPPVPSVKDPGFPPPTSPTWGAT